MNTTNATTATNRANTPQGSFRIGELASLVGTDAPTIRFYEAEGVLPEPTRTAAGYRSYSAADVDRLRFVKQARALGLSLAEIRDIVAARDAGTPACSYVRRLLARQIRDTKVQIRELRQLLHELEQLEELSQGLPDQPGPDEPCICHAIEHASVDARPFRPQEP